jgi:hypothetical protein
MKGHAMHRIRIIVSLALLSSLPACINDVILDPPLEPGPQFPQEDEWRTEIDAPLADDVAHLSIGGREVDGNFANRGDVEVRFDGEEGRIRVDIKRYAFAEDLESAGDTFDRLWAWAYAGESLRPPAPNMVENACDELWHDDCELRVYYDGQIQPEASGAHVRVTLPPSFRGSMVVATEDNAVDDDYPMRGDVQIVDLPGSVEVDVERGNVEISLADDVLIAPACGLDANLACDAWEEDAADAPWSLACGCYDFGKVRVEGVSSDVVIDVPPALWSTFRLENAYLDQVDEECTVDLGCEDFDACEVTFVDEDVHGPRSAEANDPGESALEGAGFSIFAMSESCASVEFADGPDDYEIPDIERRGDLRVCSGCLD